jgi:hypothetical protein
MDPDLRRDNDTEYIELGQFIRLTGQQLPIAVLLLPHAKYADFGVGDLAIGLGFRNVKMAYDSSIAGQRDL